MKLAALLIAAVGRNGEIGVNGKLPWDNREDLSWFKSQTGGDVVIVGGKTFQMLPPLSGRIVLGVSHTGLFAREDDAAYQVAGPDTFTPEMILALCWEHWPHKLWWVAGGAQLYGQFIRARAIRRSFISHIDWTGPADVYFPWGAYNGSHHSQEVVLPNVIGKRPRARRATPHDIVPGQRA